MTKKEVRSQVDQKLSEFLDGWVIVGKVAGESKFILSQSIPDQRARGAFIKTLFDVVGQAQDECKGN